MDTGVSLKCAARLGKFSGANTDFYLQLTHQRPSEQLLAPGPATGLDEQYLTPFYRRLIFQLRQVPLFI
jgi:hypothetical protein